MRARSLSIPMDNIRYTTESAMVAITHSVRDEWQGTLKCCRRTPCAVPTESGGQVEPGEST